MDLLLLLFVAVLVTGDGRNFYGHYTNDFVVEMYSEVDELAELVAGAHGFKVDNKVAKLN